MSKSLHLSLKHIVELRPELIDNDFSFVVDNKSYDCNMIIAMMISSRVAKERAKDVTVKELKLNKGELIQQVIDLYYGKDIVVEKDKCESLLDLGIELGNKFLVTSVCEFLGRDDTLERLCLYHVIDVPYEEECHYVSSHFYEMKEERLLSLDINVLKAVIEDAKLVVNDEDSLLTFILEYFDKNNVYDIEILESIRFEYVSNKAFSLLWEFFARHAETATMSAVIYRNLHERFYNFSWFRPPCERHRISRKAFSGILNEVDISPNILPSLQVFPSEGNAFNGIIAYLTRCCGGNVIEKGIVDAFCSRTCSSNKSLIAAFDNTTQFFCTHEDDAFVGYDFKKRRIQPTAYTWRTCNAGAGGSHLKSWTIECSEDGSHWTEIDRHTDNNDLNGPSYVKTYTLKQSPVCRFIRLRRIGPNHSGNRFTRCAGFELFGALIDCPENREKCE